MTIAEWCVFGAVMLYLLTIAPFKVIEFPPLRQFQTARRRVLSKTRSAHVRSARTSTASKCFRSSPSAVLLAEFRAGPQRLINELAILFLIVRIAYVLTYLGNRPMLRSILWNVGFAINLAIFFMPVIRNHLPI